MNRIMIVIYTNCCSKATRSVFRRKRGAGTGSFLKRRRKRAKGGPEKPERKQKRRIARRRVCG